MRLVNLVYRHLATVPGALEWAWYTVGELFEEGVFAARSKVLVPTPEDMTRHRLSMKAAGLSAAEAGQVIATLDAYNRANPMNALSLRVIALALESGRPATPVVLVAPPPADLPALLPMMPLEGLDAATMALMHKLARLTTGRESRIIPSLFRHFAPWPELLRQMVDWMEELSDGGSIDDRAAGIFRMADDIARDIYGTLPVPGAGAILPDLDTRGTLVETIEMFPPTICRMIAIAGLLRPALGDGRTAD